MSKDIPIDIAKLNTESDHLKLVSFCSDVVFYTNIDLSRISGEVLYVYERYLDLVGRDSLSWYSSENMRQHRKCTKKSLDILPNAFAKSPSTRSVINISLKSGQHFAEAPAYSFWVWGSEKSDSNHGFVSNVVRCSFPGSFLAEDRAGFLSFARDMFSAFPFQSGHAGYVLQTTPYEKAESERIAWQLSMHHPGLDISNPITDSVALANKCIKGVNWITALGERFVEEIGGDRAIKDQGAKPIEFINVNNGLLILAGETPLIGDINRQKNITAYRDVYRIVKPLQEGMIDRYGAFDLPGFDYREKTQAWLKRFDCEDG